MLSCVQLSAIPWTVAHQAHVSLGFSRQGYWSGLPCSLPGDLPDPGIKCRSPVSPALEADSLPAEPPGKLRLKEEHSQQREWPAEATACWKTRKEAREAGGGVGENSRVGIWEGQRVFWALAERVMRSRGRALSWAGRSGL